jgi:hypothetical protein
MLDLKSRVSCLGAWSRSCEGRALLGVWLPRMTLWGSRQGMRLALLIRDKSPGFPGVSSSFACASATDSAWQAWTSSA